MKGMLLINIIHIITIQHAPRITVLKISKVDNQMYILGGGKTRLILQRTHSLVGLGLAESHTRRNNQEG